MRRIPVVGVVSAMWQRHDLTDIVFGNLASLREVLRDDIELRLVVAGSEGEASRALAERHGFTYVDVPNEPLGAKWNAALSLLRGQDIDGVCIVGSDDLLDAAYFRMVAASVKNGEKLFGIDTFYVLDRFSGRMFLWMGYAPPRDDDTIGLGRFVHRDYIDALDWKLWQDDAVRALDNSMRERIVKFCSVGNNPFILKRIANIGSLPVDLKHEQQMWPYEITAILCHHLRVIGDPRALLATGYPAEMVARVLAPCPPMQAEPDCYIPPWDRGLVSTFAPWDGGEKFSYYHHHVLQNVPTDVFLPFSQRYSLTYLPAVTEDTDLVDVAEEFLRLRLTQERTAVQLCIPDMDLFHKRWMQYGLGGYSTGNLHIWRNMFRVYLVGASPGGAAVVKDLTAHGNVVICTQAMREYCPEVDALAALVADGWSDALAFALRVHETEKLWSALSEKARLRSLALGAAMPRGLEDTV